MSQQDIIDILNNNPNNEFSLQDFVLLTGLTESTVARNLRAINKQHGFTIRMQYVQKGRFKGYVRMYRSNEYGRQTTTTN